MNYQIDFSVILAQWPAILAGVRMTLLVAGLSFVFAIAIGILLAIMRLSKFTLLQRLAIFYLLFFRSIPLFVFLLWLYYGLSLLIGINFKPLTAGVIVLSVQYGAQFSEIFRSGVASVGRNQFEAGLSLGLRRYQVYRRIVIPQALIVMIPPMMNTFVAMLKDTSIVSAIGVAELMRVSEIQSNYYFRPFEFFTAAAFLYIAMVVVVSQFAAWTERRLAGWWVAR